ncbi:MAG: glycosyltransferase family 2 protein [Lachnospiraceae bacterium]|nr:glycosyltransferase family 2 protein [Lachnospiraceae bacterium]
MRGRTERYGWAAYYAAAYEKERQKNIVLAGKIADAQRRQADLNDNLNRIYGSPFWKMTAPFRKLYHSVKGDARHYKDTDRSPETDPCLLRYTKEVHRQQNPYAEWIKEYNERYNNTGMEEEIEINGWKAVSVPESDIVLLTYGRGKLDRNIFDKVKSYFNENNKCIIAYADEDFYWENLSYRMQPWFKPCYSPDTMLSFNYWGYLLAVKADVLSGVLSSQDMQKRMKRGRQAVRFYDLCLGLEEAAISRSRLEDVSMQEIICHIDGILYHHEYCPSEDVQKRIEGCRETEERFWLAEQSLAGELENGRYLVGAGAEYSQVREAALERRGVKGTLTGGGDPGLYHIIYDTSISGRERCARAQSEDRHTSPHYVVSVVIPSKDHPEVLRRCLESFRTKTDYRYYEWIVVDNGSNEENRAKLEKMRQEYGFTYIYEKMDFNFSKMCNMGAARANGDLILLMNDDIEIIEHSWLRRMAGQALQPHAGAVGAKLWYADTQNIQHAGITNMEIGPSHKLITFPDDKDYYYGRNRVVYNMIGVTAACLMVSRKKYEEVGGLDETMAVAYNDVDFCFKLIEAGYYNVQRNDVVLYHHESLSRGLDEEDESKWERLLTEKENLYAKHPQMKGRDAFYHKALIDNASNYGCNYKFPHEEHLHTMTVEPYDLGLTKGWNTSRLRLTVDRAEKQHKIHADEPDILWIMGWCYIPGVDNACYDKHVLLMSTDDVDSAGDETGQGYCAVPADWYRKDVEAILPMERNIGLAGFVLRVLRDDLPAGTYRIGMSCAGTQDDKLLAWSDKTLEVV